MLLLGGNGMMGSEAAAQLVEAGYRVTSAHRGHGYWDSKARLDHLVRNVLCDRDTLAQDEACISELYKGSDTIADSTCSCSIAVPHYDVVVDFSSFRKKQMQQAISVLAGRVGLYIYISTDSVYEVSAAGVQGYAEPWLTAANSLPFTMLSQAAVSRRGCSAAAVQERGARAEQQGT